MRKIIEIKTIPNFNIQCTFDNGEIKNLDITGFLDRKGKFSSKVFDVQVFNSVKIGEGGELYWDGIAEMKALDGSIVPCNYDICPDFAYYNSSSSI